MPGLPASDPSRKRPLRILEVGAHEFFSMAVPEQTDLLWTGTKPDEYLRFALCPIKLIRAIMRLRRGEYDLLVVHATQYAPWHPRSFLTALRSWHVLSSLGLFAIFAWRVIHWFHKVPIAAIDFSDSCLIGKHNHFLLKSARAFFKRELPSDHWLVFCQSGYPNFPGRRRRNDKRFIAMVGKLRPISYGAPSIDKGRLPYRNIYTKSEKTADVFFAGGVAGNSTVRGAGLAEIEALKREGYVIDMPAKPMRQPEFFKRMSRAWLAWSPAGLGWDCGRHYEAPLVGTVPVMSHPTILRDTPLRDGEHCVLYTAEPGELSHAVRTALADKSRLRDMAKAGGIHVASHHTLVARAGRVAVTVLGRRLDGTVVSPSDQSRPASVIEAI
jgi:hypothetical protein